MYNMSSGLKELTQIRKITAEKYSENKFHTLCVTKNYWWRLCHMDENEWFTRKLRSLNFMPLRMKINK